MAIQIGHVIFFFLLLSWVDGHGRLLRPPARSSLWRFGYKSPINYDDNQLYCGGRDHQISLGGRCGICGDPYDEPVPRTNEIGGPVYRGYITERYLEQQVIEVDVHITANHKGFIQFKICSVPGFDTEATQECLDRHVLTVADSEVTEIPIHPRDRRVKVWLQLPAGLTCQHCVFQWRYHAGNSWGQCVNGSYAVGCGPQEEFYGCSDVAVGDDVGPSDYRPTVPEVPNEVDEARKARPIPAAAPVPIPARPAARPARPTRPVQSKVRPVRPVRPARPEVRPARPEVRPIRPRIRPARPTSPATSAPTTEVEPAARVCVSVGAMSRVPGMDAWCQLNCNHSPRYCPPEICRC
ncbi:uncharacterized protein LOC122372583 [Amphibalanus amphitrite]|uniref:uncharacterized protein LOC122372583 n=1 Tax=Amphibalanus amphitrite TaxID=1232801 RepID=UPI001C924212|nr:uncharacterized protein LOC122372583 [Amphibalanus amphitrite]